MVKFFLEIGVGTSLAMALWLPYLPLSAHVVALQPKWVYCAWIFVAMLVAGQIRRLLFTWDRPRRYRRRRVERC